MSEVAQLKEHIRREYEAGVQALYGPALGTAQHHFINARLERMAQYHERLGELLGKEQATGVLCEIWEDFD